MYTVHISHVTLFAHFAVVAWPKKLNLMAYVLITRGYEEVESLSASMQLNINMEKQENIHSTF